MTNQAHRPPRRITTRAIVVLLVSAALCLTALAYYVITKPSSNPVPSSIRDNAAFVIYYPDVAKLPAAYTLDTSSIKYNEGAIIFTIHQGDNTFYLSVQAKPDDKAVQDFLTKQIPLNTTFATKLGTAALGAIDTRQVSSLVTKDDSWILLTGPSDATTSQFSDILASLKH